MRKVSGNPHRGNKEPLQPDSGTDDPPSKNTPEPSNSYHGRSVAVNKIPSISTHSDELRPIEDEGSAQEALISRRASVEMESRISLTASDKRNQKTSREKEELEDPVLSADVIEWEGSTKKQLEQLASNLETAQKNEEVRQKKKERKKRKKQRNSMATAGNASPLMTLDSRDHKSVAEKNQKQEDPANSGFFHSHHPGHDNKMTRSHLQAHLKIVVNIEDILLEVLKAPANKSNSHYINAEAFEEMLMEIEALLDEWMELPPQDTTIYPREGLKELIEQFRDETGYAIKKQPQNTEDVETEKQIDLFLGQFRQLFPIDESGSLNQADSAEPPAVSYFREVSEKITDMIKYQTD